VPPKRQLADLPRTLGGWDAQDSAWINGDRFFPGVAAETARIYHTAGKEIFLYIGYFAIQRSSESLINPYSSPLLRNVRELPVPKAVAGLQRVNNSVPTIDGKRYETIFWYRVPSGNTTGRYETKWRQLLDAVVRKHNNGAVVLLAIPASENPGRTTTIADLYDFAGVLAPVLEEFLP
jgi:EpsI family protein